NEAGPSSIEPTTSDWYAEQPTSVSMKINVFPSTRKGGLSKRYSALLVALVLLLIAGGSYAYSAVNTSNKQVTATAVPSITVTPAPTIKATPTATANPVRYNDYVAKHGVMFGFNTQSTRNNPY